MTGHPEAKPTLFPTLPWGRLGPREHREPYLVLAEAWRHRCADTMPNSAQSRLDSMADADQFLWNQPMSVAHGPLEAHAIKAQMAIAFGFMEASYQRARLAAHAAFQACPGLKL